VVLGLACRCEPLLLIRRRRPLVPRRRAASLVKVLVGVRLSGDRVGPDPRQQRADRDRLLDLGDDLKHAPRGRRWDLRVDLVGGDLTQRLVSFDPVADPLVPGDDRALGDRHADLRHRHLDARVSRRGAHGMPP
jgi:hypothetical protein